MRTETTGDGPTLLLLHGLGATGEVWNGFETHLRESWQGSWIVPDLPGHGRSEPLARYTFGGLAAAVAAELPGSEIIVLGHSLGGVLGLTLASGWFGVPVRAVCGLGIKVEWTPDDLAKAAAVAAKPARVFATREEAAERWLKVAGLFGLWDNSSPLISPGLVSGEDGWRTALDPLAFAVGAPDMHGLISVSKGQVLLAAGENDPMSPETHLRDFGVDFAVLPNLGHNAHVEAPDAVLALLNRHFS
ncbi:alpha/beta fold hydrolase [Amycolatopsis sp. cg5]|uniref:alpha/beta fold hydrolase n=1 Tax=Amycolatopsis sp. cg5 TaxID=3238802 RepID=UPI003523F25C